MVIQVSIQKDRVKESTEKTNLSGLLQRKLPHILEYSSLVGGSADAPADFVRRIQDQGSQIEKVFHPLELDSIMGQSLGRVSNSKGAEDKHLGFIHVDLQSGRMPAIAFSMRAALASVLATKVVSSAKASSVTVIAVQ